jgi:hypothetical protein
MELIGECKGNNGNGCFMDSCGHDCGCFTIQERSYSEEEVIELLQKYRFDLSSNKTSNLGDTTEQWFEKFKNK